MKKQITEKYVNAFLDGFFSDKNESYGMTYYHLLEEATKKVEKKYKQYKIYKL